MVAGQFQMTSAETKRQFPAKALVAQREARQERMAFNALRSSFAPLREILFVLPEFQTALLLLPGVS